MADAYIDDFGLARINGRGEGQELKNQSDVVTEYLAPIHRVIVNIDYDNLGLPDGNILVGNGFGRGIAGVPANALVVSAKMYVTTAATDPTKTIDVGLEEKDGTAIDADGLIAAQALSVGVIAGAGALVGTKVTDKGFVVATSNGTAADLKGLKGSIVIEYVNGY